MSSKTTNAQHGDLGIELAAYEQFLDRGQHGPVRVSPPDCKEPSVLHCDFAPTDYGYQ